MRSISTVLLAVSLGYLCYPACSQPVFNGSVISVDIIERGLMLSAEHVVLKTGRLYGNIRAGYGEFSSGHKQVNVIPAGIVFFNRGDRHHVHFGAIASFMKYQPDSTGAMVSQRSHRSLYIAPLLGYRFQQPSGGIFFKIEFVLNRIVNRCDESENHSMRWLHFTAMGMGYYFTGKKSHE